MNVEWTERFATRTQQMRSSAIREILKLTQQPEIISFAGGLPAPDYFPIEEIKAAARRVIEKHGKEALQYGVTEGYLPLREMLVRHMRRYGVICAVENILITTGSQQALDLIGRVLIDPGDQVIVEEPTYLGALQAWNAYGADYITLPMDDEGMRTDVLEHALRETNPKFIYALPNFQNPTGVTLSNKRRVELACLADQYHVPIIEDDPYGQLRYEGQHESSLFALEGLNTCLESDDPSVSGHVLYLSTFSKTLCPGLRVGWIVGPEPVISRMVQAKQGMDLHTSPFAQMVAFETAQGGFLDYHIQTLRRVYAERRDAMLSAMAEHFPETITWTRPAGGLFLWVTLPEGLNSTELLKTAIENKVAFVPGAGFYPCSGGENTMRLNFSNANLEQIEIGIERLAGVIRRESEVSLHAPTP